jgi:hypothetical protein
MEDQCISHESLSASSMRKRSFFGLLKEITGA